MSLAEEKVEAEYFIRSLINKTLRIQTKDSRMFVGTFKCTDPVRGQSFHTPSFVAHHLADM